MRSLLRRHITAPTSIAPLVVFRVLFGFLMLVSTIRFAWKGWIAKLYLEPDFFFTYYGFDWVEPMGAAGMYGVFGLMGLAALGIMLGWRYRWSAAAFFLCFTYVELLDKTHYLNHYYFVSIIAFLLIWVPAHRRFSLDVLRSPSSRREQVPAWMVNIFLLQLGIVYFYAGVAKLNPDWLLRAMPMKIWLAAHAHWPLIGPLLDEAWTAYLFSWAGAFYDLTVAFFLCYRPTRPFAYAAVIMFHLFTYALFQIGMFPVIMILLTLVFFSPEFHERCLEWAGRLGRGIRSLLGISQQYSVRVEEDRHFRYSPPWKKMIGGLMIAHFALQLVLPLRFMLYPGNVMWHEQGYRFSWRVMLIEKRGSAVFNVTNPETSNSWQAAHWRHLTPRQEKMMAMKPDMMIQYARYLEDYYQKKRDLGDLKITVTSHVTLNGRRSQPLVNPAVDLTAVERGWHHKQWVEPMNESVNIRFTNSNS